MNPFNLQGGKKKKKKIPRAFVKSKAVPCGFQLWENEQKTGNCFCFPKWRQCQSQGMLQLRAPDSRMGMGINPPQISLPQSGELPSSTGISGSKVANPNFSSDSPLFSTSQSFFAGANSFSLLTIPFLLPPISP